MCESGITVSNNSFAILSAQGGAVIPFDEINKIFAYKIDELTSDLICCDVVTGSDDATVIRTIHEDLRGFDHFMVRLEVLPGFKQNWRDAILRPAFAENRTVIYERTAKST